MPIEHGTIVGDYRIEGLLGRGGMGIVYTASHLHIDRRVALKVLSEELSESPEFVARFRREGRLQASLDHPHVVTVYEAGESDHGLYLAMRLIPGPTLSALLRARAVGATRAVALLRQVGDALDAAHAAGLVHRDVKPQNVLVGAGDDAYLGDFGLVRSGTAISRATVDGRLVGTIAYLAPEVIGGADAGAEADRYALAAVAFECLTGTVVFPRGTDAAVLFAHTSEPPPNATGRRPELPPSLDRVFADALAKDPDRRPASARALVDALGAVLEEAGVDGLGPPPVTSPGVDRDTALPAMAPGRSSPRSRRGVGLWLATSAVAGAVLALAGAELVGDGATSAAAAVPPPLPGTTVLGSDLSRPGTTLDCRGRTPRLGSPECTIRQAALPGATLVIPEDGVIRRWAVRSAHGELSLAVLRPREGKVLQIARGANEFVENDGVFVFPANLAVERGDLVGLVVIGGSGVGARPVEGAATERWLPHVGAPRPPDFAAGDGFDNELLFRVEYVPGGKLRNPAQVTGPAAAGLPDGHVIASRQRRFADGKSVRIDVVEVGGRVVMDAVLGTTRYARIDLLDFPPGGTVIRFHADQLPEYPEGIDIYVEYAAENSNRLLPHYFGLDGNGFELVD